MSVADREARFIQLVMAVVEETATPDELSEFRDLLREYPEFKFQYLEQMRLHGLMCYRRGGAWSRKKAEERSVCRPRFETREGRTKPVCAVGWKIAAAAAVALALGAAMWKAEEIRQSAIDNRQLIRLSRAACRASSEEPAAPTLVRLEEAMGTEGLIPSDAKPGVWCRTSDLRLTSGRARFRLVFGAEVTLVGPAELSLRDGMEATLVSGRLLARVPLSAQGFTVHTPRLTAWDLGTVFGVMTREEVSDVFVFKGKVQVTDAEGEGVGLCEAGEGARAIAGKGAFKIAADGAETRRLFVSVGGDAAAEDPAAALGVATRIADWWVAHYLPEEAWRIRERAARETARLSAPKRAPFRKTAWVRPSAPVQQGVSDMKTTSAAVALAAAAVVMGTEPAGATSASVVVDTSPIHNRRWTTIHTNEVPLQWDWTAAADRARLEITGMNGTVATNFATVTSNWLWRAFSSDVPSAEDVYDLRLTFYGGGDAVVGALTSRLAVVTGAFGAAAVDPGPSDRKWTRLRSSAVIPYDACWTEATADAAASRLVIAKTGGATQTNTLSDAGGYFGWKVRQNNRGYGTFDLSLSFLDMEGEWTAELTWPQDGFMIKLQ